MLTPQQVNEAMGRAALVYELLEVERRQSDAARRIAQKKEEIRDSETFGREREEVDDLKTQVRELSELWSRLDDRREEIISVLWGADAQVGELGWSEKIEALNREQALVTIEAVLRRRPEVSPPEEPDSMDLKELVSWLVEKIDELPEGEKTGWTP